MSNIKLSSDLPIGVFDSGMGGLTVLKQLQHVLPHESFIYLGDTARLPYGTKSQQTVIHYAKQMAEILVTQGIKCLVVACNTASMAALSALKETYPWLPVLGVIEPGAKATVQATEKQSVLVLATEATVASQIYTQQITQINEAIKVASIPCSLFVALAEEGFVDNAVAREVIKAYLPAPAEIEQDCLLLGCTHFPVLKNAIHEYLGADIVIVDSAIETAKTVQQTLESLDMLSEQDSPQTFFLVTDLPSRFARIGKLFLSKQISQSDIEMVVP